MNHVTTSVEHVLMVVKTGMLEHFVLMVRNIDFFVDIHAIYRLNLHALYVLEETRSIM